MSASEYKVEQISHYVELETDDETVVLAEWVLTESILSRKHEVWNVQTDKNRYWVVTDLTNLYNQRDFPSYDNALTFHLGLMLRMGERDHQDGEVADSDHVERAWRRYSRACVALGEANEAEDFQAIGMRCREILLAASSELAEKSILDLRADDLQRGNFIEWVNRASIEVLPGPSNERLRKHFRDLSINAWNLASWLTHYQKANYFHANYTLDATRFALSAGSSLALRHKLQPPETCPECGSYEVESYWVRRIRPDAPGVVACAACDWERTVVSGGGAS